MTRPIRSACKSTKAGTTITLNAPIPRWHNAMPRHPAAPHSASSTRITRVQKRRRGDETVGIAVSIELIQRMGGTPDWARPCVKSVPSVSSVPGHSGACTGFVGYSTKQRRVASQRTCARDSADRC